MMAGLLLVVSLLAVAQGDGRAAQFRNPVVPGFHPDPSVCRVGDDFYLVCSSFQYFPGVPILHSKDLVNWEQIGNVLDRESQLPLQGSSSWLGIYAPTIRYNDGTYYMITTNVGNGGNFMVTARDPRGPWSEPIWLEQQGIDPSLYFEDGKCYMVSNPGDCIYLCEIDPVTGRQLTASTPLWQGDGGRYPEGPHLYKKDGYYYLLISEGGTELAHHLTIARSRRIEGPYESNPNNPILTNCCRLGQGRQVQGVGHGDFVEAQDGSWWVVFLAYRNFGGSYHHLGRETYLAPVEWKHGEWPVVNGDGTVDTLVSARTLPLVPMKKAPEKTTFDQPLGPEWMYMQNPILENYQVINGRLRLRAHSSLSQNQQPTFVGRRQESAQFVAETEVMVDEQRLGSAECGLTVYQIHDGHIDLAVRGREVLVTCFLKNLVAPSAPLTLPDGTQSVRLRVESDGLDYHFSCSFDGGQTYQPLRSLACSLMSTEVAGGFTGVTLGLFAAGEEGEADFSYFSMRGEK